MGFQRGFRPLPAVVPSQDEEEPPWIVARYPGSCSECGEGFIEDVTEIQADESGYWRGDCCR